MMEKLANKTRDIKFFSKKNGTMMTVHSAFAKRYADRLEQDEAIQGYQTNVVLENWQHKIDIGSIRKAYMDCEWTTDFLLILADGGVAVREIIMPEDFEKKAAMERLELSRRYWAAAHVNDWGTVTPSPDEDE